MSDKIYVIPKKDLLIPDPADGKILPPDGKPVVDSHFWRRRANPHKDVTITNGPKKPLSRKVKDS